MFRERIGADAHDTIWNDDRVNVEIGVPMRIIYIRHHAIFNCHCGTGASLKSRVGNRRTLSGKQNGIKFSIGKTVWRDFFYGCRHGEEPTLFPLGVF